MSKRALVIGGSGFLGSHVADELSSRGIQVSIFDIRESPYLRSDQRMIEGDILDRTALTRACEGMHYVYNFGGLADINDAKNKPLETANLNILGNLNALEAAVAVRAERFIFASTVYVYSESGSFYRVSKQASEKFVELYYETYGLPFTILRYGSLYGRRADNRNTIYRFIEGALKEGKIHYTGTGKELREYIHAVDAAKASVDILAPEFENQHLVLTGHQSFHVGQVMAMISEILQNKVELAFDSKALEAHYNITPYHYKPRVGKKLMVNPYIDMGQGVLDVIHEFAEREGMETPAGAGE